MALKSDPGRLPRRNHYQEGPGFLFVATQGSRPLMSDAGRSVADTARTRARAIRAWSDGASVGVSALLAGAAARRSSAGATASTPAASRGCSTSRGRVTTPTWHPSSSGRSCSCGCPPTGTAAGSPPSSGDDRDVDAVEPELAAAGTDVAADRRLGHGRPLLVDQALPDPPGRVALLARRLLVLGQPARDRGGVGTHGRLGPLVRLPGRRHG